MGAWRHSVPPGAAIAGPDPAQGRGQYWVVVGGAMRLDGETLGERSCVFVRPDEPPLRAVAGPGGAEIVAMQFPRKDR
jgi:hypothetical protein